MIQLGEKDIDSVDACYETVITMLVNFAAMVRRRFSVKKVFICQLILRKIPRTIGYNDNVRLANNLLYQEARDLEGVSMWILKGIWNPKQNLYLDGVHFNDYGHIKLYNSDRVAVVEFLIMTLFIA